MSDYATHYAQTREEYDFMYSELFEAKKDFWLTLKIDRRVVDSIKLRFNEEGAVIYGEALNGETDVYRYGANGRVVYRGWIAPRRKNNFPKRLDIPA